MQTELDELATRAANDRFSPASGVEELIKSVIEKTRRDFKVVADQPACSGRLLEGCALVRKPEGMKLSW